jgi:hypothetical protein
LRLLGVRVSALHKKQAQIEQLEPQAALLLG